MKKTELMIEFEQKTGKQSAILKFITGGQALEQKSYPKLGPYDYNIDYIAWLESNAKINYEAVETFQEIIRNQCDEITALKEKTEAYDRIMSGGRKTLKEWANIFGAPVAVDKNLSGIVFDEIPELLRTVEAWRAPHGYVGIIPSVLIDFTGDWKDSLTLPDGWEEK